MSKEEIMKTIQLEKPFLIKEYKISEIGIFGSIIRGEETTKSDIDILVDFKDSPSIFGFIRLKNYLEDKLKKKVDLVHKPMIKSALADQILKEVVIV